jgi:MFS family permease
MGWAWLYPLALCASVMAFSVLMPRVAVQLSQAGHSGIEVGFFSMLVYLVVFLSTPIMPRLYRRFGLNKSYVLGLTFNLLSVLGLTFFQGYGWLCATALVAGLAACCLWGATETLIAFNAPAHRLGAITGLYQTLLGSVLALGPFLPGLLSLSAMQVTVLVLFCLGLAFAMIALASRLGLTVSLGRSHHYASADHELSPNRSSSGPPEGSWAEVLRAMPVLLLAALVGGLFEAGIGNVGSVQSMQYGVAEPRAVFFSGMVALGSLAMQWPIGLLADRFSYIKLLRSSVLILLGISIVACSFWASLPLWWLSALVWGGMGGALYTLTMITVGHRFRGAHTARYASATIAAYTLGCMIGPFVLGLAFDVAPRQGVAAVLTLVALVALAALWLLRRPLDLGPECLGKIK